MTRARVGLISGAVAGALVAGLLVFLQVGDTAAPADDDAVTGRGTVSFDRLTVESVDPDVVLTVADPDLPDAGWTSLGDWLEAGAAVGTPLEVSASASVADGLTLTKSYPRPLPEGATATLAWFDPELGEWSAVPTELSEDRTRAVAEVDHLSVWTDLVATVDQTKQQVLDEAGRLVELGSAGLGDMRRATSQAILTGADAIFYTSAKYFDVRVDPPTCNAATPTWVNLVTVPEFSPNNPVHWCSGRDKADDGVLELKARVNRGYGFTYTTAADPEWTYNSGDESSLVADGLDALTDLDAVLAGSVRALFAGGSLIGPGEELSLGFAEDTVRDSDGPLVALRRPGPAAFLASVAAQAATQAGVSGADGRLATWLYLASCGRSVTEADDIVSALRAIAACSATDQAKRALAGTLGEIILARPDMSARAAGQAAGRAVGRASIALALLTPVITTASYAADGLAGGLLEASVVPSAVAAQRTTVHRVAPYEDDEETLKPDWEIEPAVGDTPLDCLFPAPSPNAVGPGTVSCGTTADSAFACLAPVSESIEQLACVSTFTWPEQKLFSRVLGDIPEDLYGLPAPTDPLPFAVKTTGGLICTYRSGGAVGIGPGGADPAYYCQTDDPADTLFAVDGEPIIKKSSGIWSAKIGEQSSPDEVDDLPDLSEVKLSDAWFLEGMTWAVDLRD